MKMEIYLKNSEKTYRSIGWIIHLVAWGIVFCLPFFFTGRNMEEVTTERYIRFIIVPLSFMALFYLDYFLLIPRYIFVQKTGKFLLVNAALIILTMIAVHALMQLLPPPDIEKLPRPVPDATEVTFFLLRNAMMYALVAGLSVAIRITARWYEQESTRKELERVRVEAELKNLKSQLNPHFLFNTLNNIYTLILLSPDRAQCAVHDLSKLLRYVLYESNLPAVPIEKEMDFVRNYVELMRIRLPESTDLKIAIDVQEAGLPIAPLLFISLIENAFKHGVSHSGASYIWIHLQESGGSVRCDIENSYFPKDSADRSGSGIGLTNLRKRLELIYPGKYTFSAQREGTSYHVKLNLQIK